MGIEFSEYFKNRQNESNIYKKLKNINKDRDI